MPTCTQINTHGVRSSSICFCFSCSSVLLDSMIQTSRSQHSSAQRLFFFNICNLFVRPLNRGLLISDWSTSPRPRRRSTGLRRVLFLVDAVRERRKSLQEPKHQEHNHCTVVTLHKITWTDGFTGSSCCFNYVVWAYVCEDSHSSVFCEFFCGLTYGNCTETSSCHESTFR